MTADTTSSDSKLLRQCSSWRAAAAQWQWLAGSSLGQELSGSLGDLGTFLPLVVALSATIQLDLGTTLLFSGLYNVASGVGFQIPMCVQPMKTIAAVALAAPGLSLPEVMAAGLFVGGTVLVLGATGAMDLASRAVPGSIVRGIQLAVGLQLAQKGVTQVFKTDQHSYRQLWGVEGCVLGVCAAAALLITTLPAALSDSTQQLQQQHQHQQEQEQQQHRPELEQQREQEWQQAGAGPSSQRKQQGGLAQQRWAATAGAGLQRPSWQQQQQPADTECMPDQQPQPQHQYHHHQPQQQQEAEGQEALAAAAAAADGCGGSGCGSSSASSSAIPSALLLVLLGVLLTVLTSPGVLSQLRLGPSAPRLYLPTWEDLKGGVLKAGLAQLPLTSLNSVIAVSHLAAQLFPDRVQAQGWRWRPGVVAVAVGAVNLLGCWFGAFPCCFGSGGLAAQYKFGARTGLAPVLLGGMKITLALLFGSSLLQLLQRFPQPLLGALLLLSGVELAASARKETEARGYTFMLLTAAAILGLHNTAVGFAVGLGGCAAVAGCEAVKTTWQRWRPQQQQQQQQQQQHRYQRVATGAAAAAAAGLDDKEDEQPGSCPV